MIYKCKTYAIGKYESNKKMFWWVISFAARIISSSYLNGQQQKYYLLYVLYSRIPLLHFILCFFWIHVYTRLLHPSHAKGIAALAPKCTLSYFPLVCFLCIMRLQIQENVQVCIMNELCVWGNVPGLTYKIAGRACERTYK